MTNPVPLSFSFLKVLAMVFGNRPDVFFFFRRGGEGGRSVYMGSMMHRAKFGPGRVQESPKNKIQIKSN